MRRPLRTGFNFVEVLFAVMLLGIGMIMIAAIFPVALSQSRATMQETTAATVSRGGVGYVQAAATEALAPHTVPANPPNSPPGTPEKPAECVPIKVGSPLWNALKGNMVLPSDSRYGAAVFYRRGKGDAFAQVIVIPTTIRNQGNYEKASTDLAFNPQPVTFDVDNNRLTFSAGSPVAVDGAYVVVGQAPGAPRMNGRIFRLAGLNGGAWDLAPGWDLPLPGEAGPNEAYSGIDPVTKEDYAADNIVSLDDATGYIVGRGLNDPSLPASADNIVEGPAQDIAAYTTFISIR